MTLLSESYYCVSSLLKLTMTFQMLYAPTFYIQLRHSTDHPNGKEKCLITDKNRQPNADRRFSIVVTFYIPQNTLIMHSYANVVLLIMKDVIIWQKLEKIMKGTSDSALMDVGRFVLHLEMTLQPASQNGFQDMLLLGMKRSNFFMSCPSCAIPYRKAFRVSSWENGLPSAWRFI